MPLVMVHSISSGIFIITTVVKYFSFHMLPAIVRQCNMYVVCMLSVFLSRLLYIHLDIMVSLAGDTFVLLHGIKVKTNTFPH